MAVAITCFESASGAKSRSRSERQLHLDSLSRLSTTVSGAGVSSSPASRPRLPTDAAFRAPRLSAQKQPRLEVRRFVAGINATKFTRQRLVACTIEHDCFSQTVVGIQPVASLCWFRTSVSVSAIRPPAWCLSRASMTGRSSTLSLTVSVRERLQQSPLNRRGQSINRSRHHPLKANQKLPSTIRYRTFSGRPRAFTSLTRSTMAEFQMRAFVSSAHREDLDEPGSCSTSIESVP